MTRKELVRVANKIVEYEKVLQNSDDPEEIQKAQAGIIQESLCIRTLADIDQLDDLIQEKLKNYLT